MTEPILHLPMNDEKNPGKDIGKYGLHASLKGELLPHVKTVAGRKACVFEGGAYGKSYMSLPAALLDALAGKDGFTVALWVCPGKEHSFWERLFDFGRGKRASYVFLARGMRGVCFSGTDLAAVSELRPSKEEWSFVTLSVSGTAGGTASSAGPKLYINGVCLGNGEISQTTSGQYRKLEDWFSVFFAKDEISVHNYIGHSQFDADPDFCGAMRDFMVFDKALSEEEICQVMSRSLTEKQVVDLAYEKFFKAPVSIVSEDILLPESLMGGQVLVSWKSSRPEIISNTGKVCPKEKPEPVKLAAFFSLKGAFREEVFDLTVCPKGVAPYELTILGNEKVADISPTLFGLFYEDINRSADGGLYAEMVQNRSFENFVFDTYDRRSGENGVSTGRRHLALQYWFGDLSKVEVRTEGGLNEHFSLPDPDTNTCYIHAKKGARIYNHGFCDGNHGYAMVFEKNGRYDLSMYARAKKAVCSVLLLDENGNKISKPETIEVQGSGWKKVQTTLIAQVSGRGQLSIDFFDDMDVDMVSLMPEHVWGSSNEEGSATAHANYLGNPNYRLRPDLVKALLAMKPRFLRFPGGCISEGSFIWDNVYDWKDSVGDVACRKENFNVWGYVMTMGLGYMEYFQLAEDLSCEPLPVMACGVLCQARSDYVNPAGGALREKYIKNFTDLIDFAISTDFEKNEWARLRRDMGHPNPFGLHYLGVGNENWGRELFVNFEAFRSAIDAYMETHYPGYPLTILSTVGAQADDRSFEEGWRFLYGAQEKQFSLAFTDGKESFTEDCVLYKERPDHMDTIADEHFYRANDYLLENTDRYDHYPRVLTPEGKEDPVKTPKVFIGEYASSEKNTLSGAIAEAAVMTGFERNSDVVRMAATAPLFNHVSGDGTYRWTPDCIWFDEENVWFTPTYYVQKLFAEYIGTEELATGFSVLSGTGFLPVTPEGRITITLKGRIVLSSVSLVSETTGETLLSLDLAKEGKKVEKLLWGLTGGAYTEEGFFHQDKEDCRIYLNTAVKTGFRLAVSAIRKEDKAAISCAVGVKEDKYGLSERAFCVGYPEGCGVRIVKNGKEGYKMGDFACGRYAGPLRACFKEAPKLSVPFTCEVGFGSYLTTCYEQEGRRYACQRMKVTADNRYVFSAVSRDQSYVYVKLVNTDEYAKTVKVSLKDLAVEKEAEQILFTGPAGSYHTHMKNAPIGYEPEKSRIDYFPAGTPVTLPALSLTVLKLAIVK